MRSFMISHSFQALVTALDFYSTTPETVSIPISNTHCFYLIIKIVFIFPFFFFVWEGKGDEESQERPLQTDFTFIPNPAYRRLQNHQRHPYQTENGNFFKRFSSTKFCGMIVIYKGKR